jgi:hypothetical protein
MTGVMPPAGVVDQLDDENEQDGRHEDGQQYFGCRHLREAQRHEPQCQGQQREPALDLADPIPLVATPQYQERGGSE